VFWKNRRLQADINLQYKAKTKGSELTTGNSKLRKEVRTDEALQEDENLCAHLRGAGDSLGIHRLYQS
jgi:hypothetical protein